MYLNIHIYNMQIQIILSIFVAHEYMPEPELHSHNDFCEKKSRTIIKLEFRTATVT